MTRRVVTGLTEDGRSGITIDDTASRFLSGGGAYIWRAAALPADNGANSDQAPADFDYDLFHDGGSNFFVIEMEPGTRSSTHATDTLDFIVMLDGVVALELEAEEVQLRAGDTLVDRGVIHTWRNDGPGIVRYAVVTVPAHPVGSGRTV